MKMSYVIVRCEDYYDEAEIGIPVCICDEKPLKYGLGYAHYKINDDNTLTLVKSADIGTCEGMALYYWKEDEDPEDVEPTVIKKYPNKTRRDAVPKFVKNKFKTLSDTDDDLGRDVRSCGYTTGFDDDNNYWVYGEYRDNEYELGY